MFSILFFPIFQACGKFINTNAVTMAAGVDSISCSSPELLAKYCDFLLKKSSKNTEECELEENLHQVVSIDINCFIVLL
jgi:cullin 1